MVPDPQLNLVLFPEWTANNYSRISSTSFPTASGIWRTHAKCNVIAKGRNKFFHGLLDEVFDFRESGDARVRDGREP